MVEKARNFADFPDSKLDGLSESLAKGANLGRKKKTRIQITPEQLEAIYQERVKRFPALPWEASEEEEAKQRAEKEAFYHLGGRPLVSFVGEEDGCEVIKETFVYYADFPETPTEATTSKKVATSSKPANFRKGKTSVATSSKTEVGSPKQKKLPRAIAGCYWTNNGAGWLLNRSKRDVAKRNPRIGHLSESSYKELKRNHKGNDLTKALTEWAKQKAEEKGIPLDL